MRPNLLGPLARCGVAHSEIENLGAAFGLYVMMFEDPDGIQLALTAPRGEGRDGRHREDSHDRHRHALRERRLPLLVL